MQMKPKNVRSALLLIDVQVCNFHPDPVYKSENLLAILCVLREKARTAKAPIIHIQHCGPKGAVDEPHTPGWEIHPDITPRNNEVTILKHHPDAFQDTDLHSVLTSKGVTTVVVTGIQTEYCVDTTCRRAYSLGYKVILVENGHSMWDSAALTAPQIIAHHNDVLGGWFVELQKAQEIVF
jgi:nicotinamidase-related amidase